MYTSIFKLKYMLEKSNINFNFIDRSTKFDDILDEYYQILVYEPETHNRIISVVQGEATYGGSENLLEIQGCLTAEELEKDSVKGYLTAEEVYERIQNALI